MIDDSAITFDVDWAPDFAILQCMDLCRAHNTPATFFVTHRSPVLLTLSQDPLFEVGIHPNFLPGSTHGGSLEEVMDHCLGMVPQARTLRAHSLYQSSRFHVKLVENYPSIESEVSMFLPGHVNLEPVFLHVCEGRPPLLRLPYLWADDIAACDPPRLALGFDHEAQPRVEDLAFHPLHIALNMERLQRFRDLKSSLGGKSLADFPEQALAFHQNRGLGSRSFLESLLRTDSLRPFRKISEIAAASRLRPGGGT